MERVRESRETVSAIYSHALAIAAVAAALAVTLLLQSAVSTAGYIFFYAAVLASAWFGGKWQGWLAAILSAAAVDYYFTPPVRSFHVNLGGLPVFVEFAATAAIVGWFSSWRKMAERELRHARDDLQMRVEERTAELRQTNERLLAEMAERRRAEEAWYEARTELARANRISALGALAASISHEVNQPLAAVVTNADACSMWLSAEPANLEEARAAIDRVAREGTRASEVVRRIRAMFSKAAPETAPVQINDLIRDVRGLLEAEISRNGISVKEHLAADLVPLPGDRVQLQQVLVNLVTNGIEAMSGISDRPRLLQIRSQWNSPNEVMVAVRDSGTGISGRDERRIFDPFYSTKSEGMGMGLSICRTIVEAHGGRLWATANEDHGTTLQFVLPVEKEVAP